MGKQTQNIILSIVVAISTWFALGNSTIQEHGMPELSVTKVLALIVGVVFTTLIYYGLIAFLRWSLVGAYKPLIADFKSGDRKRRIVIIIAGTLVLLRLIITAIHMTH